MEIKHDGDKRGEGDRDERECYEYVMRLLGEDASAYALIDYVRRLINAADAAEEWLTAHRTIEEIAKKSKTFPGMTSIILRKHFDSILPFGKLFELETELQRVIEKYYTDLLRLIFNDPKGQYFLAWHDFCHTGRNGLMLHPPSWRSCAKILLCEAQAQLNTSEEVVEV